LLVRASLVREFNEIFDDIVEVSVKIVCLLSVLESEPFYDSIVAVFLVFFKEVLKIGRIHQIAIGRAQSEETDCLSLVYGFVIWLFEDIPQEVFVFAIAKHSLRVKVIKTFGVRCGGGQFQPLSFNYLEGGPLYLEEDVVVNPVVHVKQSLESVGNRSVHLLERGSAPYQVVNLSTYVDTLSLEIVNDGLFRPQGIHLCV